jgi:hypothetical protein
LTDADHFRIMKQASVASLRWRSSSPRIPDRFHPGMLIGFAGIRNSTRVAFLKPVGLTEKEAEFLIVSANKYSAKLVDLRNRADEIKKQIKANRPPDNLKQIWLDMGKEQYQALQSAMDSIRETLDSSTYQRLVGFLQKEVKPGMQLVLPK